MTLRIHPDDIVAERPSGALGIHGSWERVRLSAIADVLNGFAFPSTSFASTGEMPLIRIRDVGRPHTDTWYSGPFDRQYVVEPGSVIVGMDGDFRADKWLGPPALLNQRVCKITVRDPQLYSPEFLRYALPGYLDAINRLTSAVTVKHLSSETVKDLPLPLPPRVEQDRIVAAIEEQFSRLDAGVAALERARQNLERMRASVLNALLADNNGRPWPTVRIDSVLDAGRYGTSTKCAYDGNGLPVLRIPNVQSGRINLQDIKRAIDRGVDLSGSIVEEGDVLIVRTNGSRSLIGRAAAVPAQHEPLSFASYLIQLKLNRERINPQYLVAALSAPWMRQRLESLAATTAGQYNISLDKLRSLEIPCPPLAAQLDKVIEFDRKLSTIVGLELKVDRACHRERQARTSILASAFSGTLVRQDSSNLPASTLLERIATARASSNGRASTGARKPGTTRPKKAV